jgi:hypothetical protein
MKRFYKSVIEPLCETLRPQAIVEVGAQYGSNTTQLLEWCRRAGAVLHSVDPAPSFDVRKLSNDFSSEFRFHRELSLSALAKIGPVDLALIDGDHNWYTVVNELRIIRDVSADARRFPVVLFHDIGWPYARRDLYYDPSTVPEAHRQPHRRAGLLPEHSALIEHGWNNHLFHAEHEGGPRNGVLTAIEDFIRETKFAIRFVNLPGLNGLGILTSEERLQNHADLRAFVELLDVPEPIARHLEMIEKERMEYAILWKQRAQPRNVLSAFRHMLKLQVDEAAKRLRTMSDHSRRSA